MKPKRPKQDPKTKKTDKSPKPQENLSAQSLNESDDDVPLIELVTVKITFCEWSGSEDEYI